MQEYRFLFESLPFLIGIQSFLLTYLVLNFRNLKASVRKDQKKSVLTAQKNEILLHSLYLSMKKFTGNYEIPFPLMNIPFADETGVVLSVKRVQIPSLLSPYNASIGLVDREYVLFFRYDTPSYEMDRALYFSNIGCIGLNQNFEPLEKEFSKIHTGSLFSEDARFFQSNGSSFLVYNDRVSRSTNHRGIYIGAMNWNEKKLEYITALNFESFNVEKNWTPFSYQDQIHFVYTINPQKFFALPDPRKNLLSSSLIAPALDLDWSRKWGTLRGGTPAVLVDGEYLSFFHSSFEDHKGIIWYVMGAYTFSATTFKMTRVSPHPILFKEIYNTAHQVIANSRIRSIYPAGLICEHREGKDWVHVSCGENDSGIKIISMDQKALLASLQPTH